MKTDKLDQLLRASGQGEAEQMPPEVETRLQHLYEQIGQRRTAQQIRDDLAKSSPSNTPVAETTDHGVGHEDGSLSVLPTADGVMTAQPERKPKRHRWIRQSMTAAAVLVIGVGGVLGSGFFSADMARSLKQIPGTEYVYRFTSEMGWQTADEREENAKPTIQQNGVTLTLESLVYDGRKLGLEVKQQTEQKNAEIEKIDVLVNGRSALFALSELPGLTKEEKQNPYNRQSIDSTNTQYRIVQDLRSEILQGHEKNEQEGYSTMYSVNPVDQPEAVDMVIRFRIKGMSNQPFVFNVHAQRTSKFDVYAIAKPVDTGEGVTFDQVAAVSTPLATYVHVELGGFKQWSKKNHNQSMSYDLMDSQQNMYLPHSRQTWYDQNKIYLEYDALPATATGITLISSTYVDPANLQIRLVPQTDKPTVERPIVLNMGSSGSVNITGITETSDHIQLHVIPAKTYQLYEVAYSLWYDRPNAKSDYTGTYPIEVTRDPANSQQYILSYDKEKIKGNNMELYYTLDRKRYLPQISIPLQQ